MYPVLFTIGAFDVTSHAAVVCVAVLVGIRLFNRGCRRRAVPPVALHAAVAAVFAGLVGSKLLWVLEHLGHDSLSSLLFARGGMSWFGGLAAGVGIGALLLRQAGIFLLPPFAAGVPALALGQGIGRIGCFLAGDDYGRATDLPWGVAFPQGMPPIDVHVHPAQLYEAAFLVLLWHTLERSRARGVDDRAIVSRYFLSAGACRFALEFVRTNTRIVGPFTIAHFAAAGAVALGVAIMISGSSRVAPAALPITRPVL